VGIAPAPRGTPQIEVTFDIDANGIVNVSAKDKATGKEQQIRIQASGGLSEADIQRMIREAEQHASADKKRRELIEARNQADALIYSVERQLKDDGSGVSENDRRNVEAAIATLRTAMSGEDIGAIRQRSENLTEAMTRLSEAIRPAGATAGGSSASPDGSRDNVVDAEFEDVDDQSRRAS
jgi:molecular chaperone DnaK